MNYSPNQISQLCVVRKTKFMIAKIKKIIPNKVKRDIKGFCRNIVDSFSYYIIDGRFFFDKALLKNLNIESVIFVCKGNVCRSTFAECRLQNLTGESSVVIDSCGVDVDQGNYPPADSVKVAEEYSCSLSSRHSKSLQQCDIAGADLIFPVEYWQYRRLVKMFPEKKQNILLLRTIAPFPYSVFCNITDPYGWGEDEFRKCYKLIERSITALLTRC